MTLLMLNHTSSIFSWNNTGWEIWECSQYGHLVSQVQKPHCSITNAYSWRRYFRRIIGCDKEYMCHNCFLVLSTMKCLLEPTNYERCVSPHHPPQMASAVTDLAWAGQPPRE